MAKIRSGITGKLLGNIGQVEAGTIHSANFLRTRKGKRILTQSSALVSQHDKFRAAKDIVLNFNDEIIRTGLTKYLKNSTWYRSGISINIPLMIGPPQLWPRKALLMKGNLLSGAIIAGIDPPGPARNGVSFVSTSNGVNSFDDDLSFLAAWNQTQQVWVFSNVHRLRSNGVAHMNNTGNIIAGDILNWKLFFYRADFSRFSGTTLLQSIAN